MNPSVTGSGRVGLIPRSSRCDNGKLPRSPAREREEVGAGFRMEGRTMCGGAMGDQCGESCCPWSEREGNFLVRTSELGKVDSFAITDELSRCGGKYQVREGVILQKTDNG